MVHIRISSVSHPFKDPRLQLAAMGLLHRAAGMGLLPDGRPIERLDLDAIERVATAASDQHVGLRVADALSRASSASPDALARLMDQLEEALTESPLPVPELRELRGVYDEAWLAEMAGASEVSLRRYAAGSRTTPDAVAARIHYLALVTSDLAGSYNAIGLRAWWDRPRSRLDGRSPRGCLGRDWDPAGSGAATVAGLAAELAGVAVG